MKQQVTVANIADFILQEYKKYTRSAGLYNGKAGLSLSLFIASEYLQDEKMEDIAYDLIKESLVIKQTDCRFETGLAGIGYALLFLIENKYLDAEFDDLFGEQYEAIIKGFDKIEQDPVRLVNSLKDIYFLSKVGKIKKDDRIEVAIKKIFEGCELFFTVQSHDFTDIHYVGKKMQILNIYNIYLKLVDHVGHAHFSPSLLETYASLYRSGKIASFFETGYYLNRITGKYSIEGYEDCICENIDNGLKNSYPNTLYFGNSLIACIPGHLFMKTLIDTVFTYTPPSFPQKSGMHFLEVMTSTGPLALVDIYEKYQYKEQIFIIPAKYVSPYSISEAKKIRQGYESEQFDNRLKDSYSVHYFFGDWLL